MLIEVARFSAPTEITDEALLIFLVLFAGASAGFGFWLRRRRK